MADRVLLINPFYPISETPAPPLGLAYLAGALEAIYKRTAGFYSVEERHCKMMRDETCAFQIKEA